MRYDLKDAARRRRKGTDHLGGAAAGILLDDQTLEASVRSYLLWAQLIKNYDSGNFNSMLKSLGHKRMLFVPNSFMDVVWHAHQVAKIISGIMKIQWHF